MIHVVRALCGLGDKSPSVQRGITDQCRHATFASDRRLLQSPLARLLKGLLLSPVILGRVGVGAWWLSGLLLAGLWLYVGWLVVQPPG